MKVTLPELTKAAFRVGVLSFGGPAAQIALMHKEFVEDRPWLTEDQYLRALSFCMLLPGPEAMQLATYTGWRLRGIVGGLITGGLFVLPGALVILALALAYVHFGDVTWVQAGFLGIKAAVVVIVLHALKNIAKKALKSHLSWVLACAGFVALFFFNLPFPMVIAAAALIGAFSAQGSDIAAPSLPRFPFKIALIGITLWALPIAVLWVSNADFFLDVGLFFSKLAVVTFGGAYAVLSYMTQSIVGDFGWITTQQMMDALGLAETTPGPLILVTEFVATVAGAQLYGTWGALAAALLTLWVTFVPCFIWIFVGAPFIDALTHRPRLAAALAAVTATVVGVIANLSVWFAAHVMFETIETTQWFGLQMLQIEWDSLNLTAVCLTALAAVLTFWRKMDILWVLLICAGLGIFVTSVF